MRLTISEYRARFTIILLLTVAAFVFDALALFSNIGASIRILAAIATVLLLAFLFAYRRGGNWATIARYLTVAMCTIMISIVLVVDEETRRSFNPGFFVAPVIALIMLEWRSILLCGLFTLVVVVVGIPSPNPYLQPSPFVLLSLIIICLAVARLTLDSMRHQAETAAAAAVKAQQEAEKEAAIAHQQAAQLQQQSVEQQRLLELVNELETPVVTIAENVLLMPIIGAFDKRRAEEITRRLLREMSNRRTRLVMLDLAGLNNIDMAMAQEIYRLIHAVRLLGCQVTITSISSSVAIALTRLGISTQAFDTARSPQEVLNNYFKANISQN